MTPDRDTTSSPTAHLLVAWGAAHREPAWSVCNHLPIEPGATTVLDLMRLPEVVQAMDPQFGGGEADRAVVIGGVADEPGEGGYRWCCSVNGLPLQGTCATHVLAAGDVVVWRFLFVHPPLGREPSV